MNVLFILISLSSIVAGLFLFAFIWSVKSGQYDEGDTPAVRMLFEDAKVVENESDKVNNLTDNN